MAHQTSHRIKFIIRQGQTGQKQRPRLRNSKYKRIEDRNEKIQQYSTETQTLLFIQTFKTHTVMTYTVPGLRRVMPQPPPPAPVNLLWSPLANVTRHSVSRAECPTPITFRWCWLMSMSSYKWKRTQLLLEENTFYIEKVVSLTWLTWLVYLEDVVVFSCDGLACHL